MLLEADLNRQVGHSAPRSYVLLETLLSEYRDELLDRNAPMIVRERLEKIGEGAGITKPEELAECIAELNAMRRLIIDEDSEYLKKFVVLDPIWLQEVILRPTFAQDDLAKVV